MSDSKEAGAEATDDQSNEDWVCKWQVGNTLFHHDHVSPFLKKFGSVMINGRSNVKVLVPLCGKTLDMKWLADQGVTVIGVEVSELAIVQFSEEQGVPLAKHDLPAVDGSLYKSADGNIQIYCCDLFKLTKEVVGLVDAIWDKSSLVALNIKDRERYAAMLKSVMAPGCRYLLSVYQHDNPPTFSGKRGPRSIEDADVQTLYGNTHTVKELEDVDIFNEFFKKEMDLHFMREKVFLIC